MREDIDPDPLDLYEEFVRSTAVFPKSVAITYCIIALCGEAGELANVFKKQLRVRGASYSAFEDEEVRTKLADELGDVLWYVTALARELGYHLDDIMTMNMTKLRKRKVEGTIAATTKREE